MTREATSPARATSPFCRPQALRLAWTARDGATDNIFTERLWRSLKYEEVYLHEFMTPRQAREGIRNYLDFYNTGRPHQALNYKTPAETYFGRELEIHTALWPHHFPVRTE